MQPPPARRQPFFQKTVFPKKIRAPRTRGARQVSEVIGYVRVDFFSDDGDLDGDRLTNAQEHDVTIAAGGSIDDFATAGITPGNAALEGSRR